MAANTKARHEEIYTAAVSALEAAGGVVAVDQLPELERYTMLHKLYRQVKIQTNCHIDTAKKNVAKAMHHAQFGVIQERWGGARPGPHPGRPAKEANA